MDSNSSFISQVWGIIKKSLNIQQLKYILNWGTFFISITSTFPEKMKELFDRNLMLSIYSNFIEIRIWFWNYSKASTEFQLGILSNVDVVVRFFFHSILTLNRVFVHMNEIVHLMWTNQIEWNEQHLSHYRKRKVTSRIAVNVDL